LVALAATSGLQPGPTQLARHQVDDGTGLPDAGGALDGLADVAPAGGASPGAPAVPIGLPVAEMPGAPAAPTGVPPAAAERAGNVYDALLAATGSASGLTLSGAATAEASAGAAPGTPAGAAQAGEATAMPDDGDYQRLLLEPARTAGFGPEKVRYAKTFGADGLEQAVVALYTALGMPPPTAEQRAAMHEQAAALDPRERDAAALLLFAAVDAQLALAESFASLDPVDLHLLRACAQVSKPAGTLPCADPARAAQVAAEELDRGAVARAGLIVASALEQATPMLRAAARDAVQLASTPPMPFQPMDANPKDPDDDPSPFTDPYRLVEIGGSGDDVYQGNLLGSADARVQVLTVDPLGDDTYLNTAGGAMLAPPTGPPSPGDLAPSSPTATWSYGALVSISIDVDGNDNYVGSYGVQGSGRLGVGILLDLQGDDTYSASSESQGFGSTGIGLLADSYGTDQYSCNFDGQGHGRVGGLGVLYDGAGNDRYAGDSWVQGVGVNQGAGFLIEVGGNDQYLAQPPTTAVAQGATDRVGVGVFVDNDGIDRYTTASGGRGYIAGIFPYNVGAAVFRDYGSDADLYSTGSPGGNNRAWQQGTYGSGEDA
jgi:hypothetical protein